MSLGSLADPGGEHRGIIGQDTEIGYLHAKALKQPDQQKPVGIENRTRRAACPGFNDFIPGRKKRAPHPAPNRQRCQSQRRRQRNVLSCKAPACGQHNRALTYVLASEPTIGTAL